MQQSADTESVSDRVRHNFSKSYLADLLGISRPTLYKYMGLYDHGVTDDIPGKVLEFFDFISKDDRTYDEMTAFLEKLTSGGVPPAPVKKPEGLGWVTKGVPTVPMTSDGSLTVIFKDAFPNPAETYLRIIIEVSGERHVLADIPVMTGMHYFRVDDLPKGIRMEYIVVQTGPGMMSESEPHGFTL